MAAHMLMTHDVCTPVNAAEAAADGCRWSPGEARAGMIAPGVAAGGPGRTLAPSTLTSPGASQVSIDQGRNRWVLYSSRLCAHQIYIDQCI